MSGECGHNIGTRAPYANSDIVSRETGHAGNAPTVQNATGWQEPDVITWWAL